MFFPEESGFSSLSSFLIYFIIAVKEGRMTCLSSIFDRFISALRDLPYNDLYASEDTSSFLETNLVEQIIYEVLLKFAYYYCTL